MASWVINIASLCSPDNRYFFNDFMISKNMLYKIFLYHCEERQMPETIKLKALQLDCMELVSFFCGEAI